MPATDESDQQRREEVRREVRRYLAERPRLAFKAETISQRLWRENNFTIDEIKDALEYEKGRGHVESIKDPDGVTPFYKITTAGVHFQEESQL